MVAVGSGIATVTATAGGISDACEVTVTGVGGYLLDAIGNDYLPTSDIQRRGAAEVLPGPDYRTHHAYQPGVQIPVPGTSTWPVCYGGWSMTTPGVSTAAHEMQFLSRFRKIRFVNAQGGKINALVYWNLPDPVVFDGLNLSTLLLGGDNAQGDADIHFVIKSGNELYVSHSFANKTYLGANGFSYQLNVNSTDWQLWDFTANGGDNFVVSFAPPAGARRLSAQDIGNVDAIGLYISANTTVRVNRDIQQVGYTASNIALPVRLAYFTAASESGMAQLSWSTTEETNSSRFEVQHSPDARNWDKLGEVAAGGERTGLSNYGYTHVSPSSGLNYYRLKMVDRDGGYEFSPVKSVVIEKADDIAVVYPNPTTGRFGLRNISGPIRGLEIYTPAGQRVASHTSIPSEGVDVSNLAEGLYIVKVRKADGMVVNNKIVVQK